MSAFSAIDAVRFKRLAKSATLTDSDREYLAAIASEIERRKGSKNLRHRAALWLKMKRRAMRGQDPIFVDDDASPQCAWLDNLYNFEGGWACEVRTFLKTYLDGKSNNPLKKAGWTVR